MIRHKVVNGICYLYEVKETSMGRCKEHNPAEGKEAMTARKKEKCASRTHHWPRRRPDATEEVTGIPFCQACADRLLHRYPYDNPRTLGPLFETVCGKIESPQMTLNTSEGKHPPSFGFG